MEAAATSNSTGTPAVFLHPVEALHGDLGFTRSDDAVLLFSYSGETIEVIRLARELKRVGCSRQRHEEPRKQPRTPVPCQY